MYLLVGHEADLCCQLVANALRDRGHRVLLTADPLADPAVFRWALDTTQSESAVCLAGEPALGVAELRGVLVRAQGGPVTSEGWTPADLAYVRAEAQAALLAWLWSLPCPVVNRPPADVWFRPQRPFPEWHMLFAQCGLPTLAAQLTNDLPAARRFAERWGGAVTYMPLTSHTRYPVSEEAEWSELVKVLERIPVCLVEPCSGPSTRACLVGSRVVWDGRVNLGAADRGALEAGLRKLGARLGLDVLEVELLAGPGGARCVRTDVYPQLELHGAPGREAIVAGIVELLEKGGDIPRETSVLESPLRVGP